MCEGGGEECMIASFTEIPHGEDEVLIVPFEIFAHGGGVTGAVFSDLVAVPCENGDACSDDSADDDSGPGGG